MARLALSLAAAALSACAVPGVTPGTAPSRPSAAAQVLDPTGAADPRNAGTIVVLEVMMPEPGVAIGEQFAGALFSQRIGRLHMTEVAQRRWGAVAVADAERMLRERGYPVRTVSAPSSDAERADGIRFALAATVQSLSVRSTGRLPPLLVEATATVSWELLDLAAGRTVFGLQVQGQGRATDSIDTAALAAVRHSLERFLADTTLLAALLIPASEVMETGARDDYGRRLPTARDTVVLRPEDLNVVPADEPTVRAAAAVVALRARSGNVATGFLISRDGLAITRAAVIRRGETSLWARFPNGVQRRVRVVRKAGRLALVQVACADPCRTVDISLDPWPPSGTRVVAIGAPFDDRDAFVLAPGTSPGGCGLFSGSLRSLEVAGATLGGEPVARADDGTVVGVVTRPGCATELPSALRSLGIRVEAGPR